MSDKRRWPLDTALAVAEEIVSSLAPACRRIEIGGSIRRKKPAVGDIEIVFVGAEIEEIDPSELPGLGNVARPVDMAEPMIAGLVHNCMLRRRPLAGGRTAYGYQNKLLYHLASGIPVDLFRTTDECWWNYLVCRTGGAENNRRIAMAAQANGWKWNPYGAGFSRATSSVNYRETYLVRSERAVFDFVGLPYLEPWERQ